ncbi:MaoC/PaaZ C-terminal domain-containing protein [Kribbia dieselivorans]|uniref:MaoC/PaaZ C-terminal domain-containing protein n=1 Tax=Kribbia dieselivorans TaxID=331526 RepID=UPI00083969D1|nr:MaoC/PaaZ C-terminal domain-containing protein [Kribbia dieselivorans]
MSEVVDVVEPSPGLWFEDLAVGQVYRSVARTVTETDLTQFSMLSGDWNAIHSDVEFSKSSFYGQRVVHGVFGIALLTGLMDRAGWFAETAVGMVGIDGWRFGAPIFVGDTLHCEMEITSTRMTSKGDRGIVGRLYRLINQRGEVVQSGEMPAMILARPAVGS